MTNKIISEQQLHVLIEPFFELPINRSWKGYGSALFLEVGKLNDGKGDLSIMIEWSWRVERGNSIWFGSWSDFEVIDENIPTLTGKTLKSISLFSRLPELSVSLSENIWVNSFATEDGDPEWALIFGGVEIESKSGNIVQTMK